MAGVTDSQDPDFASAGEGGGDAGASAGLSYETVKTGDELASYIEDIADTVRIGLDQSIAILTPWFFNNMPMMYYQTTPRPEKVRHLSAIITGHVFETKQTVELWDRDQTKVTLIGPGGDRRILVEMARKLIDRPLKLGSIYSSRDNLLVLSTFYCGSFRSLDSTNPRIAEKVKAARVELLRDFPDESVAIDHFLGSLDSDFVTNATVGRLRVNYRMVRHMRSHEGAHTVIEPVEGSYQGRVTLGVKGLDPSQLLESLLHLAFRYNFDIHRAFIVRFDHGYPEPISVVNMIVSHGASANGGAAAGRAPIQLTAPDVLKFSKALRTLAWVDIDEYSDFTKPPFEYSISAANLIRGLANLVHILGGKENPYYYSHYKIRTTFQRYQSLTSGLVEMFRTKFDPAREDMRRAGQLDHQRKDLLAQVDSDVVDEIERSIFRMCVRILDHLLKTNYFLSTKTGLAFRLAPEVLDETYYPQRPFGIFFLIGRDYRCFHVRWKDVSRGGMRVVMPRSVADHDYALAGLFDEVYGLSGAQQLKNKDIPEGGSKAVLVLRPGGHRDRAVRGAVNALLDLLVSEDESHEQELAKQVSYYQAPELIYLGPDENLTNDLIEWITEQAERRGYRFPRAFMSSKPGEGINHKQYGVTSEGLHVYVHNMLQHLGINPAKEKVTFKLTGGPDGDVAGNELKILHREYGENVRVVAVADGFGAAFDPEGLKWGELLRLVRENRPIAEFDAAQLSKAKSAFVIKADSNETRKKRDMLCMTAKTDVFIPAGGRPYTIHDRNWQLYLDEAGVPSSRAVVEGANIFFSAGAREQLQKAGLLMIKDSSANKTGVVCSSYEVIASLLLSRDEFMALKDVYVKQVLDILRAKADSEAKLLFRELRHSGGQKTLVQLSMEISREINEITDFLLETFSKQPRAVLDDPLYQSLILRHCPPVLVEHYRDRILQRLPEAHQIAIVATYIASYVVYREGLGWLDEIPATHRLEAARTYLEQDCVTADLVDAVTRSGLKDRDKIVAILKMSAARDLTILELEQDPGS